MLFTVFKLAVSASVIAFASWLAGKRPELAGFIVALPLMTLLVLPFAHAQYHDPQASIQFAKSIFVAVPLSLVFFIPFLFADVLMTRLHIGFWGLYCSGLALLVGAYGVHQAVMKLI